MNEPASKLRKPIDWDEMYPGRFLKSGELLGKKVTVTIEEVYIDELENDKGKKIHGLLSFKDKDKQLALNKTNGICLKAMFGRKLTGWIGKRIVIFQDQTRFGAETVDCIRVWGSPDIAAEQPVLVNLPRKKPFTMIMHKTESNTKQQPEGTSAL